MVDINPHFLERPFERTSVDVCYSEWQRIVVDRVLRFGRRFVFTVQRLHCGRHDPDRVLVVRQDARLNLFLQSGHEQVFVPQEIKDVLVGVLA